MCEIEHFVDPTNKSHPKFELVKDYDLILFTGCNQMNGMPAQTVSIGDAVAQVYLILNSISVIIFCIMLKGNVIF